MFTARTFDSGMDTGHEVPRGTVLPKRNEPLGAGSCVPQLVGKPRRGEEAGVCRPCEIFLRTDLEFALLRASGSKTRSCSHKEVPPCPSGKGIVLHLILLDAGEMAASP